MKSCSHCINIWLKETHRSQTRKSFPPSSCLFHRILTIILSEYTYPQLTDARQDSEHFIPANDHSTPFTSPPHSVPRGPVMFAPTQFNSQFLNNTYPMQPSFGTAMYIHQSNPPQQIPFNPPQQPTNCLMPSPFPPTRFSSSFGPFPNNVPNPTPSTCLLPTPPPSACAQPFHYSQQVMTLQLEQQQQQRVLQKQLERIRNKNAQPPPPPPARPHFFANYPIMRK
jgi:hypothetical protein